MAGTMKSLVVLVTVVGLTAGFGVRKSTTEGSVHENRIKEKDEISPVNAYDARDDQNGLIEVSEKDIPEGAIVYVLDELALPRIEGESMEPADNIVFRPLFQYRNRQEALQRRRISNGYRRRYFIQRRPYRNVYYQYNHHKWT